MKHAFVTAVAGDLTQPCGRCGSYLKNRDHDGEGFVVIPVVDHAEPQTPPPARISGPFGPQYCAQGVHDRQTDDGSCYVCGSPDPRRAFAEADEFEIPPSVEELRRRWAIEQAIQYNRNPGEITATIETIADTLIAYILRSPQ